ncbi:MAG: hypothetical protein ACXWVP_09210, partial [Burkholderiales bacterium]
MQMHGRCGRGRRAVTSAFVVVLVVVVSGGAHAQWKPDRNVEIIVGTAAGGPLDTTARLVQKIVEARNPGVPVSVQNKTGGGHAIALAYLNQFAANGHYLAMSTPNLITNRLSGSNPINYTDVTPLALLNQ